MAKLRILVVDDSVVVRRLLTEALSEDGDLEVIATAPNGRMALDKIARLLPDLVVLDLEMPELDGMQTLAALRARDPALPVIVFSQHTAPETATEARLAGANDVVVKPALRAGAAGARAALLEQLIPAIKRCGFRVGRAATETAAVRDRAEPLAAVPHMLRGPVDVVAIGVSTGGPNALAALLTQFPAPFPVPVVIVQHMPAGFTQQLARRLDALAAVNVREAIDGELLEPGQVLIAPGDFHLNLETRGGAVQVKLLKTPAENSCRPAVDVLFRSVAAVYGSRSLAVVLTGMGKDGLRGCETLRAAGGQVLVQDEASSVVWGMPGAVVRAGLAEQVLGLAELGPEIVRRVWLRRSMQGTFPNRHSINTKG